MNVMEEIVNYFRRNDLAPHPVDTDICRVLSM
jgi:hypothetical protein